jgi:hypothetical protein
MTSDTRTHPGRDAFRNAGTGQVMARECLPCRGRFLHSTGGAWIKYRGIRCWACAECAPKHKRG